MLPLKPAQEPWTFTTADAYPLEFIFQWRVFNSLSVEVRSLCCGSAPHKEEACSLCYNDGVYESLAKAGLIPTTAFTAPEGTYPEWGGPDRYGSRAVWPTYELWCQLWLDSCLDPLEATVARQELIFGTEAMLAAMTARLQVLEDVKRRGMKAARRYRSNARSQQAFDQALKAGLAETWAHFRKRYR